MDLQRIIYLVKETKEIITNREMAAHVKENASGCSRTELPKRRII